MLWHHVGGMVFGLTTAAFIFSGLMSMNPFRLMDFGAPRLEQRLAHAGGDLAAVRFELDSQAGAATPGRHRLVPAPQRPLRGVS